MPDKMDKAKLAKALKENSVAEITAFLCYLDGYLNSEEEGKFEYLMSRAMEYTDIKKSFNK